MQTTTRTAFGCDVWGGRIDKDGYSRLPNGQLAYKALFEAARGVLPEGKHPHHRCLNRACVRLSHLVAVTKAENEWLKQWRYRSSFPICDAAHPRAMAIVTPQFGVVCRLCNRDATPEGMPR